ncbi:uncharacterized protein [Magallana gigas]|uniref:uncharacterized protein n=1 Tax=Magallana gigas TaxID=29159 RepID=UPI00148A79AF|nr:uncharacterized protein LOC105336960 [Crassostrea gigas]
MKFIILSAICFSMTLSVEFSVIHRTDSDFRVDPEDCSRFYIRRNGKEFQLKCPGDDVVNTFTRSCVPKGSSQDTCVNIIQTEKGNCSKDSRMVEYSDNCAKYIDCKDETTTGEPNVKECPFPLLFDDKSQKCEHFSMVRCGTRYEPKDACEYEENQCRSAHCVPCHVRFPSCRGSTDGLIPWGGREWSPYFAMCQSGRVVFQGQCPAVSDDKPTIFHPVHNVCMEIDLDD